MALSLGQTLVIANPASRSGAGAEGIQIVDELLTNDSLRSPIHTIELTQTAGDGERIAAEAAGYATVLVIGGDGIIHEVVNGLMQIEELKRPRLGIIPLGSGNDFARTLKVPRNKPEQAMRSLLAGRERMLDLGLVNGTYFMETLSFGIDAAIAIDTIERRAQGASQRGALLFATSGLKMFSKSSKGWSYTARFDDSETISGSSIIFACQMGPTYGGGFRICPAADPSDGLLDICYSTTTPPVPVVLGLFAASRFGAHVGAKSIQTRHAKSLEISFDEAPPCQVDGEPLEGSRFEVSVAPQVLRTIVPANVTF